MYNGKMETIYESEYMNLYDLQYREGGHYYCASRRNKDRMVALTPDEECGTMQPDAVSCFVVLNIKGQSKKLLLNWEYRYPVGQYMLSVPAGLIDKGDWNNPNALVDTAIRELKEETGIELEVQACGTGESPYTRVTSAYNSGTAPTMAILDTTDVVALASQYAVDLSDEEWVKELLEKYPDINAENIQAILQKEVGLVFVHVLEDAGVYKCTAKGREDFMRFVNSL